MRRLILSIMASLMLCLPAMAQVKPVPKKYKAPPCSVEVNGIYFKIGDNLGKMREQCANTWGFSIDWLNEANLHLLFRQADYKDNTISTIEAEGKLDNNNRLAKIRKVWARHEETTQARDLIGLIKNILDGKTKTAKVSVVEQHGPGKDVYQLILDFGDRQAVYNLVYDNGNNAVDIVESGGGYFKSVLYEY